MLKLTTVLILLVVYGSSITQRHSELKISQHEILDTTWVTNAYCDDQCKQKNGTVCGNVARQCCDNQGCNNLNACKGAEVPLTCFSFKDDWTFGDTCLPDCQSKGGNECGNVDKECCQGDNCESHFFGAWYTCDDQYKIKHISCP